MARSFQRKSLTSRRHVAIAGNLAISGFATVGGNLSVEGDLRVDGPLMCLGRLTVKGSLTARDVIVGQGMQVLGDVAADSIDARVCGDDAAALAEIAERIAFWTPDRASSEQVSDEALDWMSDKSTQYDLLDDSLPSETAVKVGGRCVVAGRVSTVGSVDVGDQFNPDDCEVIAGNVYAKTVLTEGDLLCGGVHAARWVRVEGDLRCAVVECSQLEAWGSVEVDDAVVATGRDTRCSETRGEGVYRSPEIDPGDAHERDVLPSIRCAELKAGAVTAGGSILVDGVIESRGYVRANLSITSGGTITTGKAYGILAGLDVARDRWQASGYVCASARPVRILTGMFRALAKRRRGADPRPVRLPK